MLSYGVPLVPFLTFLRKLEYEASELSHLGAGFGTGVIRYYTESLRNQVFKKSPCEHIMKRGRGLVDSFTWAHYKLHVSAASINKFTCGLNAACQAD